MHVVSGDEWSDLEYEDLEMRVYRDGRIEYTQAGLIKHAPYFRDHGIDIRKIYTVQEHCDLGVQCLFQNLENYVAFRQSTDPADVEAAQHIERAQACRLAGNFIMATAHLEAAYKVLGLESEDDKARFKRMCLSEDDA